MPGSAGERAAWLDLDPVRTSVDRATSAMLAAAGAKQSAEIIELKREPKG